MAYHPEGREFGWLTSSSELPADTRLLAGRGCQNCNGSGFLGRTGLYEMLEFDLELAELANNEDPRPFLQLVRRRMKGASLRDGAVALAIAGRTTVAEAMRVISEFEE